MSSENPITCQECGSAVPGAESFCPYCGIRLERPEETPEASDDSMESTLMMSRSEALRLADAAPAADASAGIESPQPAEESDSREPMPPPDAEEIPVPAILSDMSRTEGNISPTSTSEYAADEFKAGTRQPDIEGSADNIQFRNDAEVSVDDASTSVEPRSDTHQAGHIEDAGQAASFPEPVGDEAPVPSILHDLKPVSGAGDHTSPRAEIEDEAATANSGDPEPEFSASDSIGKPGGDLSQFDSYQSPSMFDSVRIMEPGTDKPEDADTRIQGIGGHFSPGPVVGPASFEKGTPEAEEVISSTSHSIGKGDTDGKKGSKLKPLSEGTILNSRYEIIRKIGGGGMGAVYLASDNNLGGVLRAVKEMVQTHIEEEQQEKAINDFKRESMILSSLDHVSIPTIYDYFYDGDESRFYLVMKYISGGDLSSRLRAAKEGKIDEKTVCEWAVQIIDVLDYLHNQPSTIVYRDLKPSNIMIDGNSGRAMLIDFGIARSISQKEEKGVTAVGTMGYAPPELFSGNVEPRSDIYSLGSTMFHLLTGADPQSNPLLIFDFQKNPRPRQINPQLSDQIERIMMKAVQYNAEERFRSASEMRSVLEDHLLKLKAGIVTYGVGEVPASVSLSNQSVFCGFCGQRIVATDMFCAFCGAKQPIAQQGVHSEIYSQTPWTAKLVVEGTSDLSAPAFSLQKDDNLLGRRDPMSNIFPEIDLSKYDPQTKISRRHARIWREGNNFLVEDLGSSNGTILSRSASDSFRLIPKQAQVLSAGDRLRLGDATLHFIIG